jgi:hypothetical protein
MKLRNARRGVKKKSAAVSNQFVEKLWGCGFQISNFEMSNVKQNAPRDGRTT